MRPVPVGSKSNYTITVDEDHLASKLDVSLARVMSTPTMVGIMEMAAINAIKQYYDLGETSVGASIDVQHIAATPPGHVVRAEAEVTKSEGRRLEFSVHAFDEAEEIGSGIHRRAIIDAAKFNERLKSKIKAS
jgi:fluoroacetyl-CoA thioesterase